MPSTGRARHPPHAGGPAGDASALAAQLRLVVLQLAERFRAEGPLPARQLAVLSYLLLDGPLTASQLSRRERVRPQSMAATVAALESDGYVERRPDDDDQRQQLIQVTSAGRAAAERFRRTTDRWIESAISLRLRPREQQELARAIALLEEVTAD